MTAQELSELVAEYTKNENFAGYKKLLQGLVDFYNSNKDLVKSREAIEDVLDDIDILREKANALCL